MYRAVASLAILVVVLANAVSIAGKDIIPIIANDCSETISSESSGNNEYSRSNDASAKLNVSGSTKTVVRQNGLESSLKLGLLTPGSDSESEARDLSLFSELYLSSGQGFGDISAQDGFDIITGLDLDIPMPYERVPIYIPQRLRRGLDNSYKSSFYNPKSRANDWFDSEDSWTFWGKPRFYEDLHSLPKQSSSSSSTSISSPSISTSSFPAGPFASTEKIETPQRLQNEFKTLRLNSQEDLPLRPRHPSTPLPYRHPINAPCAEKVEGETILSSTDTSTETSADTSTE